MYRSRTYSGSGRVAAIFLAGPIFVTGILLGIWSASMDAVVMVPDLSNADASVFIGVVVGAVMTMLAGALVSAIPILLGASLMRRLGRHNIAMRLPVAWALAGGVSAALPVALVGSGQNNAISCFTFAFTGAICALICRWRVVWDDPAPQP